MEFLNYTGLQHYHLLLLDLFAKKELLKNYYTKDEADLLHTSLLKYKGTINLDNYSNIINDYAALVGWSYIIDTADMSNLGYEKGDMLVCITAGNSELKTLPLWLVIQSNVSLVSGLIPLQFGNDSSLGIVNGKELLLSLPAIPVASENLIGGIQLGYTQDGNNYPVEIDANNKAFVNVTLSGDHLPLSGGTMTGAINFSTANLVTHNDLLLMGYDDSNSHLALGPSSKIATILLRANQVDSDGTIHAPAFYEISDIRKKDIKSDLSLDKCYDLIDKCQTVIYSLKDQTDEQIGLIALEIEEFFPEVVATDNDGFKSLAYDRLVVICFKVLKDVIKRLEKLENNG